MASQRVLASFVRSYRAEGARDETRSYPRRTAVLLSCEVERANLAHHARRQYGLCLGLSAVRSGNRRGLAGADRAPDRADPRADETMPGDGGTSLQNVMKCNIY